MHFSSNEYKIPSIDDLHKGQIIYFVSDDDIDVGLIIDIFEQGDKKKYITIKWINKDGFPFYDFSNHWTYTEKVFDSKYLNSPFRVLK